MSRKLAPCLGLAALAAAAAGAQAPIAFQTVRYACDQGKSLVVEYYAGATRTAPDGRPIGGGHVVLTEADGRQYVLQQTMSASGIRYASRDESFVFWSKGDGAFVEQGPSLTVTYRNCMAQK
ncbi:MAG: lysozyme inhibitor [Alphaproteobacteria bacterium]|nr:lysozyme inhibitor [Alphaproteobacteria bacterium]